MPTIIEAEVAKAATLRTGKLWTARLVTKQFYTEQEDKSVVVTTNSYYRTGAYRISDRDPNTNVWAEAYNNALTKAEKSGDPIDQGIADMLGWPIMNNNWINHYTQRERRELVTMLTHITYEKINDWRQVAKEDRARLPLAYSLLWEEYWKKKTDTERLPRLLREMIELAKSPDRTVETYVTHRKGPDLAYKAH